MVSDGAAYQKHKVRWCESKQHKKNLKPNFILTWSIELNRVLKGLKLKTHCYFDVSVHVHIMVKIINIVSLLQMCKITNPKKEQNERKKNIKLRR